MKSADKPIAREFITNLLKYIKTNTIRTKQYARVEGYTDGRIRTQQQPVGTETGRLNSRGQTKGKEWWPEKLTNLQNITNPNKYPKLDPIYNVRQIIIPDPGHVFVAADLGKAELFAYLAYAGDEEKIDKLHAGVDIHTETAAGILEVAESEVSYEQRAIHGKFANFSLGYGGGWQMFMGKVNKDSDLTGLSVSAADSKRIVDGWRDINPLVVKWWSRVLDEVRQKGYLINAYGRKRIFLNHNSSGNDQIFTICISPQDRELILTSTGMLIVISLIFNDFSIARFIFLATFTSLLLKKQMRFLQILPPILNQRLHQST